MLDARRQVAHDQAGCCSESGPSALALALFITALPPPSRADVGQPDHDNASAAGLQLEAPLNEHEPVRDAARVMQTKVTATEVCNSEGPAAEHRLRDRLPDGQNAG